MVARTINTGNSKWKNFSATGKALRHDHGERRADQHQNLEEAAETVHHEGAAEGGAVAPNHHGNGRYDQKQCRQAGDKAAPLLAAISAEA